MTQAAGAPLEEVPVVVLDSITRVKADHRGAVVVAGSHGGRYCARLASVAGVRAVVFNDAGVGLDAAGIACLALLDRVGLAAVATDYNSARIGDGEDMLRRGRVSYVNAMAAASGCAPGATVASCVVSLRAAPLPRGVLPPVTEGRMLLAHESESGVRVIGIDSASLIEAGDRDCIVVTGSHGGLLGADPASAIRLPCRAVTFNDAGGGADAAGYGRLAALDDRGIAALTVSHTSARIGEARSSWDTGVVSAANERARRAGVVSGMTLRSAVRSLASRSERR